MEFLEELKNIGKERALINSAVSLLAWDQRTYMPKAAYEYRANAIGYLSELSFKKFVSDEMEKLLEKMERESSKNQLSEYEEKLFRMTKYEYDIIKSLPPELLKEITIESSKTEELWLKARNGGDFNQLKKQLGRIVDLSREMAERIGYKDNPYDALISRYEPGMTFRKLKDVMESLKRDLIPFIEKIENSSVKTSRDLLKGNFERKTLEIMCKELLETIGYDFDAGRLDETVHPFTIDISHNDTRVLTKYVANDIGATVYSTLHEGGHALYDQGLPEDYLWTVLHDGASYGIHESQSRMIENNVGRNWSFSRYLLHILKKHFSHFNDVDHLSFYKAINHVEPSLIRIEADELTYNVHIVIRTEIEEALINNRVKVSELPEFWNEKFKKYLGLLPSNDREGILQDVHWYAGMFGYFPSYMLGNLYAAQLYKSLHTEIDDLDNLMEKGKLENLVSWLKTNVHSKGKSLFPDELIKEVTDEELKPSYFINYVKSKFSKIYEIH
ncbi:MAG: carboxypeptidase M32 [Thermotogota bacterium]|nr:carboxypeptidase M32 [Thermotogota bacterium]